MVIICKHGIRRTGAHQVVLLWCHHTSVGRLPLITCEIDFIRSNMDIHIEEVLLLDDISASDRAADPLQEADLVCCAAVM